MNETIELNEGDVVQYKGQAYFLFKRLNVNEALIILVENDILFEPTPLKSISAQLVHVCVKDLKRSEPGTLIYE